MIRVGIIWCLIGYLVGAAFTDYISVNPSLTEWTTNILVYAWLIAWPIMMILNALYWIIILGAIALLIVYIGHKLKWF